LAITALIYYPMNCITKNNKNKIEVDMNQSMGQGYKSVRCSDHYVTPCTSNHQYIMVISINYLIA